MGLEVQRCRIYTGTGELHATSCRPLFEPDSVPCARTIADRIPIAAIMSRDVVCARADITVPALTELLIHNNIGCIPIVDERERPLGIVTKLDLVDRSWPGITAIDVMMPLAITLDARSSIAHAVAMMNTEDLHHVMVVGPDRALLGVLSTMDVVRWLARNDDFTLD